MKIAATRHSDPELLRFCIVQEEIINFTARQAQCKARNETQNYGADADGPQVHLLVFYQGNAARSSEDRYYVGGNIPSNDPIQHPDESLCAQVVLIQPRTKVYVGLARRAAGSSWICRSDVAKGLLHGNL